MGGAVRNFPRLPGGGFATNVQMSCARRIVGLWRPVRPWLCPNPSDRMKGCGCTPIRPASRSGPDTDSS